MHGRRVSGYRGGMSIVTFLAGVALLMVVLAVVGWLLGHGPGRRLPGTRFYRRRRRGARS